MKTRLLYRPESELRIYKNMSFVRFSFPKKFSLKGEFVGAFLQSTLVPMEICGSVLSMDCGVPPSPRMMWNVTLPSIPKPPVVPPTPPAVCEILVYKRIFLLVKTATQSTLSKNG